MASDRSFVSNSIPRLFLRHVRRNGGDPAALITRFGFPADVEKIPVSRTRVDILIEFSDACAAMLRDNDVGLHVAQGIQVGDYGLLDFVVRSAQTMRDGMAEMIRYMGMVEDAVSARLGEVRGDAVYEFSVPKQPLGLGRQINEYILGVIMGGGRMMLGAPWPVKRVWFAHARPPDVTALQSFFQTTELEFDARSCGFRFEAAMLNQAFPTSDPALHAFLQQQARSVVVDADTGGLVERVRQALSQGMGSGNVQIERVAMSMRCSARTLQRRLTEEGTSFQDILDNVRQEQAHVLLGESKRGVAEVAFLLGYSDLRPFVRAFRRWTGKTPGDYRAASH